jgi:hypothetical protein
MRFSIYAPLEIFLRRLNRKSSIVNVSVHHRREALAARADAKFLEAEIIPLKTDYLCVKHVIPLAYLSILSNIKVNLI